MEQCPKIDSTVPGLKAALFPCVFIAVPTVPAPLVENGSRFSTYSPASYLTAGWVAVVVEIGNL